MRYVAQCLCHPERPHRARGLCGPCYQRWAWSDGADAALNAVVRKADAAKVTAVAARQEELRKKTNERRTGVPGRAKSLRQRYGMTLEEYDAKEKQQGGLCAICKKPPLGKHPLYVDHNHRTGENRGLLCAGCNTLLAGIESSLFEELQRYLQRWNEKTAA
jgi:Recombination endonuclease VII